MSKPNWTKHLEMAEKRGHFTEQEKEWATEWTMCAVGEHTLAEKKALADYFDFDAPVAPKNGNLFEMGCDFGTQVIGDHVEAAKQTYALIQQWFAEHLEEVS